MKKLILLIFILFIPVVVANIEIAKNINIIPIVEQAEMLEMSKDIVVSNSYFKVIFSKETFGFNQYYYENGSVAINKEKVEVQYYDSVGKGVWKKLGDLEKTGYNLLNGNYYIWFEYSDGLSIKYNITYRVNDSNEIKYTVNLFNTNKLDLSTKTYRVYALLDEIATTEFKESVKSLSVKKSVIEYGDIKYDYSDVVKTLGDITTKENVIVGNTRKGEYYFTLGEKNKLTLDPSINIGTSVQVAISPFGNFNDRNIVKAPNGNLYLTYIDTNQYVVFANSSNNGRNWDTKIIYPEASSNAGITVDSSGNIFVTNGKKINATYSSDDGVTWTNVTLYPSDFPNGQIYPSQPNVIVDENDNFLMCYRYYDETFEEQHVGFANSSDMTTWDFVPIDNESTASTQSCDIAYNGSRVSVISANTTGIYSYWSDDYTTWNGDYLINKSTPKYYNLNLVANSLTLDSLFFAFYRLTGSPYSRIGYYGNDSEDWTRIANTNLITGIGQYYTLSSRTNGDLWMIGDHGTGFGGIRLYNSSDGNTWSYRDIAVGTATDYYLQTSMMGTSYPASNVLNDTLYMTYFDSTNKIVYYDQYELTNHLPTMTTPTFNRSVVYNNTDLVAYSFLQDDDIENCTIRWLWSVNGTQVFNETNTNVTEYANYSSTLKSGNYSKTDEINVTVYASDEANGTNVSAIILVSNSIPVMSSVTINPSPAENTDDLTCNYTFTDIDNDTASNVVYEWWINDTKQSIDYPFLLAGNTSVGWNITCQVSINDGNDNSTSVNSTRLVIGDSTAPTITSPSVNDTAIYSDMSFTINVTCTDTDSAISSVKVEVTKPDLSKTNSTLSSVGGDNYGYEYTDVTATGDYIVGQYYCIDGSGNIANDSTSFTVTSSSRPSVVVEGGGGGGGEPSKRDCLIDVVPSFIEVFGDSKVERFFIRNNEESSFTPIFTLDTDFFEVRGEVSILLSNTEEEFSLLRVYEGNETLNKSMVISSAECNDILVDIIYYPKESQGEIFDLLKAGEGNIINQLFGSVLIYGQKVGVYWFILILVVGIFFMMRFVEADVWQRVAGGVFLLLTFSFVLVYTMNIIPANIINPKTTTFSDKIYDTTQNVLSDIDDGESFLSYDLEQKSLNITSILIIVLLLMILFGIGMMLTMIKWWIKIPAIVILVGLLFVAIQYLLEFVGGYLK